MNKRHESTTSVAFISRVYNVYNNDLGASWKRFNAIFPEDEVDFPIHIFIIN